VRKDFPKRIVIDFYRVTEQILQISLCDCQKWTSDLL